MKILTFFVFKFECQGKNYDDGCYNLECEGFVQVHQNMPVDAYLEPISTYDGEQYDITIMVFKVLLSIYHAGLDGPGQSVVGPVWVS